MVICKYFQQGNCRFGQYCKFEHSYGNRSKTFIGDDKNIALQVAEEVLQAEKGGQWLLSCYGPFKERKSIPGMEDVSPEEIRWEMYQAQKNGIVDQIKAQFQQMCEQMRAKREALKHPTPAIAQMLEEIQSSGTDNAVNKGNFAFGQPQLASSNQTFNVFGQKSAFGAQNNPFGGNTFNSMQSSSSIFNRGTTNTSTNVFGGKSSFGSPSMFGSTPATGNTIFGSSNKLTTSFGAVQNSPTFGTLASQGTSMFGASTMTQSTFGQPPPFGANPAQTTSPFLKPQTIQTSVFGGASTMAPQTSNVFGGAAVTAGAGTVFGSTPISAVSNTSVGTGMFGGAMTTTGSTAFGAAPVFGASPSFIASQPNTTGSIFGGQPTFGTTPVVSSTVTAPTNVFGASSTGGSTFGALAQGTNTNNVFGSPTTANTNTFEVAPNASPFGTPISTAASPFGGMNNAANSVFATSAPASTVATAPFGNAMSSLSTTPSSFGFATTAANTAVNMFGTAITATTQSPFGSNTFGSAPVANNSPFAPQHQQQLNATLPFGTVPSIQHQQASPFGNFNKSNISVSVAMIDETGYSPDDLLTDDEKAAYCAAQFAEGHIPLRAPTKELK